MKFNLNKLFFKLSFFGVALIIVSFLFFSFVLVRSESKRLSEDILNDALVFGEFTTPSIYEEYAEAYTHVRSKEGFDGFKTRVNEKLKKNRDIFRVYLISINGKILFDTDEFKSDEIYSGPGRFIEDRVTLDYLKNKEISHREIDHEGKKVIDIFVPVKETTGSHLMVMRYIVSYDSMKARIKEVTKGILMSLIPVFVLTLLIVFPFSLRITRPIIKLRDTTVKIANGDMTIRTNINSKDEIGDLATSFDSMTEVLQKSNQYFKEKNEELQKKADDLQKKVKELQKKKNLR